MEETINRETTSMETTEEVPEDLLVVEEAKAKKKKHLLYGGLAGLVVVGMSAFVYLNFFHLTVKQDPVTVELGTEVSVQAKDYIKASGTVIKGTKVHVSDVDTSKVGTYKGFLTHGRQEVPLTIQVTDTVAPEVVLNPEISVIVGHPLSSDTIVASMNDLAGIKSLAFSKAAIATEAPADGTTPAPATLQYDTLGPQENALVVTDQNGNQTTQKFTVKVIEDYITHVTGIADMTVETGATIDWMNGITYDGKILSVTPDTSAVDLNTQGEYQVTYAIAGDDQETMVHQTAKVTVVPPAKAQELANQGGSVKTTGGTKQPRSTRSERSQKSSGGDSQGGSNQQASSGSGKKTYSSVDSPANAWGEIDPGGNTWIGYETVTEPADWDYFE